MNTKKEEEQKSMIMELTMLICYVIIKFQNGISR